MSRINDFILQCDEAPTNYERFLEYKKKFNQYYGYVDYHTDKDDELTNELHRLQEEWEKVYRGIEQ